LPVKENLVSITLENESILGTLFQPFVNWFCPEAEKV
jgi:hypothetical protein